MPTISGLLRFDSGRALDLILLGRIAIDFNPTDTNRSLAESQNFNKYVGGSPANIAVGLARLGKRIGFFGKISDDRFGDYVESFFRAEGIDVSRISRCSNGERLGLAFTEILSPAESSILMYREGAADLSLDPRDIDEDYIKSAKALLISGTALSSSPSREAAFKAIELAKRNGTAVVFDVDYRPHGWRSVEEVAVYYALAGRRSDLILGSREEFDLMERLLSPAGNSDEESARLWHGLGVKLLIIKHGKEGSRAYTSDGAGYRVKPFPVRLLKSFGGGDGYASALLYGLLEGLDIRDALEYGSASASMLVAAPSCSAAMPTKAELRAFIAEHKARCGGVVSEIPGTPGAAATKEQED